MTAAKTFEIFENLNFNRFRELAGEKELSRHVKVGFPDSYREGKEEAIFEDVVSKLPALSQENGRVLEIGPGCSHLPSMLAALCARQKHRLIFIDSAEMLQLIPDAPHIEKHAGRYPDVEGFFETCAGKLDVILTYSVIQYVFAEGNIWDFIDRSLLLLADGGEMLIGDIPNVTVRKRFFASPAGIAHHKTFSGKDEQPDVRFNMPEPGQMDDSVVMAILARVRAQGFHAWALPQRADLPMANRREDILIKKP